MSCPKCRLPNRARGERTSFDVCLSDNISYGKCCLEFADQGQICVSFRANVGAMECKTPLKGTSSEFSLVAMADL